MVFRRADESDIKRIMEIIRQAQEDLKLQQVDQWQGGYPNEEIVQADIRREENYVMEKDGKVIAPLFFLLKKSLLMIKSMKEHGKAKNRML